MDQITLLIGETAFRLSEDEELETCCMSGRSVSELSDPFITWDVVEFSALEKLERVQLALIKTALAFGEASSLGDPQ